MNADRTALFLVENRTKELYARVFDMGEAYDDDNPKPPPAQKEIRFDNADHSRYLGGRYWSLGDFNCFVSVCIVSNYSVVTTKRIIIFNYIRNQRNYEIQRILSNFEVLFQFYTVIVTFVWLS